jgi:hypothetical protein
LGDDVPVAVGLGADRGFLFDLGRRADGAIVLLFHGRERAGVALVDVVLADGDGAAQRERDSAGIDAEAKNADPEETCDGEDEGRHQLIFPVL